MPLIRRPLLAALAAAALLPLANAQVPAPNPANYPSRPIRIVLPTPPGGLTDVVTRQLAQRLSAKLGQPVVIDNKPGANTIIATESVAKSPADGYTLLMTITSFVLNPLLYAKVPYDPFKDFVAVSRIGDTVAVLAVPTALPAKTLPEFIALAKKTPGMSYGTAGIGSTAHMYGVLMAEMGGVVLEHIPYKGDASMLSDMMANRVNSGWISPLAAVQYSKEGKLRPLAQTRRLGTSALPTLPSMTEAGFPGLDNEGWMGVFAPAGTPKTIVDRLAAEFDAALKDPVIRDTLDTNGVWVVGGTAEEFAAIVRKSHEQYRAIVKRTNMRLSDGADLVTQPKP